MKLASHAVVIGSGIAGLCAAQVVSSYFDEVTVLERGAAPYAKQPRKEVPQGYHLHALLKAGEQAIEQLFPGITQAMIEDGSIKRHFRVQVAKHPMIFRKKQSRTAWNCSNVYSTWQRGCRNTFCDVTDPKNICSRQ